VIDFLTAPFVEFAFMRRALAGCVALSVGAAPVGVFLTLRRMSLMSEAMSHAILPGAAVGFLWAGLSLPAMTLGGLVAGLAVALLSGFVARSTVLREDASLAAFYLISLAAGVLLISARGSSIDLLHILFGTVLALDDDALVLLGGIATVTLRSSCAWSAGRAGRCITPSWPWWCSISSAASRHWARCSPSG
jgi:zinc/manganese transport system permease protein